MKDAPKETPADWLDALDAGIKAAETARLQVSLEYTDSLLQRQAEIKTMQENVQKQLARCRRSHITYTGFTLGAGAFTASASALMLILAGPLTIMATVAGVVLAALMGTPIVTGFVASKRELRSDRSRLGALDDQLRGEYLELARQWADSQHPAADLDAVATEALQGALTAQRNNDLVKRNVRRTRKVPNPVAGATTERLQASVKTYRDSVKTVVDCAEGLSFAVRRQAVEALLPGGEEEMFRPPRLNFEPVSRPMDDLRSSITSNNTSDVTPVLEWAKRVADSTRPSLTPAGFLSGAIEQPHTPALENVAPTPALPQNPAPTATAELA